MNTILHHHHYGMLQGLLVTLLLALCLPPAAAQDTVSGTMKGDSVFATVKGVKFYFYNHSVDMLTIDKVVGTGDTLDIPAYVAVGDTVFQVTAVPGGAYGKHLGNKKFKMLILPETLYDYGENAFAHWFQLERVVSKRVVPVSTWYTLFNSHSDYLWRTRGSMGIYHTAVLQVPFGSKPQYSVQAPWRYFTKIEEGLEPKLGFEQPKLTVDSTDYDPANGVFTSAVRVTITNPNTSGDIYYYIMNEDRTLRTSDILKYEGPVELSETSGIVAYITDGTTRSLTSEAVFQIQASSIYVQGIQVTQKNMWDVLGDKGSVMLDPKSGALVLTQANINPSGEVETGIMAYGDNLTIQLNGNSTVNGVSQGIEFNYGNGTMSSYNAPTLTIEGMNDGTDTLTINVNGKSINAMMIYLGNLTIRNCVVIANCADGDNGIYYKVGDGKMDGMLTIENAMLQATGQESAVTGVYNLNLSDNVSILYPKGASFVSAMMTKGEGGNFVGADGVTAPMVIIGRQQKVVIEPVQTDTATAVSLIDPDHLTHESGDQVNLNHWVIDNVFYSIDNNGGDDQQTGYYDSSDKSIVILYPYDAATMVYEVALYEDPLQLVASSGYTGFVFKVPAGQGTISLETQTYGPMALAVQVGAEWPHTFTTATQAEMKVGYTVTEDTYVYVYSVVAGSAAKRAKALAYGVKIFSVKVKGGAIVSGIDGVRTINDNAPTYNLAGQRVGRAYRGIVVKNGKKRIIR